MTELIETTNVNPLKKLFSACKKLSKSVDVTLTPEGFSSTCGKDSFDIKATAPRDNFDVWEIGKKHKVCNIDLDDIGKLMTRDVNKIRMRVTDKNTLETAFFGKEHISDKGYFSENLLFTSEIGGVCR